MANRDEAQPVEKNNAIACVDYKQIRILQYA
jgi:hypothetical protein